MAGTVNIQQYLAYQHSTNGVAYQRQFQVSIPAAGENINISTQVIGSTPENIALGDVVLAGVLMAKNIDDADATTSIQIGCDSGGFVPFAELRPGESCLVPTASGMVPQAQCIPAGSAPLEYFITER